MLFPAEINQLAGALVDGCRRAGLRLATAESCTGGLIAAAITEIPGSSDAFVRGYVTYSNEAKAAVLGVPEALLARVGAVSEDVARAMAEGAVAAGGAELAVSATGIAGPGGGSEAKPVGLVHLAAARAGRATLHERHVFSGGRDAVRMSSVEAGLRLALRQID